VSAPLAPMAEPDIKPGYKTVTVRNGEQITTTLVSEDATTRSWRNSNGCTATTPRAGFGPALVFNNCFGNTGTQTAQLQGETWPLTVGKKWSYTYRGSDSRFTWSGTRNCTVDGTVRIPTAAFGEQDTYKISCADHFSRYTFYVSPAQKAVVRSEQYSNNGNRVLTELLRTE